MHRLPSSQCCGSREIWKVDPDPTKIIEIGMFWLFFPLLFIWFIINWRNIKIIIRQILYFLIWLFDFPTIFMSFPLTGSAIFYGSGSWQPKYFGSGSATLIFKSYIFCYCVYFLFDYIYYHQSKVCFIMNFKILCFLHFKIQRYAIIIEQFLRRWRLGQL